MAGRMFRGVFQLGNQIKNMHLEKRIEVNARSLTTGHVPKSGAFIKPGFDFGHPPFGDHYKIPPVPMGSDGLPLFVNWASVPGAVWEAQHQGQTGLCYMFATLGSVGSLSFIKTGDKNIVNLSAQQMVDCNRMTGDYIYGGFPWEAMDYIIKGGGILPSSVYPFTGQQGICKQLKGLGVTIDGWEFIRPNSEAALKYAVAHQPVVVSICAGKRMYVNGLLTEYHRYMGGILTGPSYTKLHHSALLIGYGETVLGELFWLLLNSYSIQWGENGLFRIARGTGQRGGALGILREPLVPLKSKACRNKIVYSKCDCCEKCF